jgi:chromosome partitioning protein
MGLLQRLGLPEQQPDREAASRSVPPESMHPATRQGELQTTEEPAVPPAGPQAPDERAQATEAHAGNRPSAPPAETQRTEVIAFANQKGGVAKTTTTLNLAVAFAEAGHRVLAVDMDPQGNLTMSQGIDPDSVEKSMYDVLVNHHSIRDVIRKREIDVACASIDLAGAEIAMSTQIGRERSLEKALKPVLEDYDFVCIDTPPSLGLLTINALTAADKVIVPVQCEYLSMRGLIQLQNTLSMIREELNPDVEIEGILPTLVDSRTVHAKEAIEILEENFGDRVFATRIRKTIRFAEAPVKGTSVLKYDPDGVAAECYRELAKEVLGNGKR